MLWLWKLKFEVNVHEQSALSLHSFGIFGIGASRFDRTIKEKLQVCGKRPSAKIGCNSREMDLSRRLIRHDFKAQCNLFCWLHIDLNCLYGLEFVQRRNTGCLRMFFMSSTSRELVDIEIIVGVSGRNETNAKSSVQCALYYRYSKCMFFSLPTKSKWCIYLCCLIITYH